MAIPAWAALQCDGGHGSAAGCAPLLLPSAAERRNLFGARLPGMQESFSLSWTECGRTGDSKLSTLALCQRSAISGLVEVRSWQSSAGTNLPTRMHSFSKQSEGLSNSVQSREGGDTSIPTAQRGA